MSQLETKDVAKNFYRASAADFMKIPGAPVAYWVSEREKILYDSGELLAASSFPRKGLDTGENDAFLRFWFEVSVSECCFNNENHNKRWFPYNKGGGYRRWYGNREYVINWEDNGSHIKRRLSWGKKKPTIRNERYYFREGFSWTTISSGGFSARYTPEGALFDNGGCTIFADQYLDKIGGFINSKVMSRYLEFLSPTLNFQPGDIGRALFPRRIFGVSLHTSRCVEIAKKDWDRHESSWEFMVNPLVNISNDVQLISKAYDVLLADWNDATRELHELEEKNNQNLIDALELGEEVTPDIPISDITLNCNPHYRYDAKKTNLELHRRLASETIAELVAYSIGVMMGRYSLDKPGLIVASQGETLQDYLRQIPEPQFAPDDDAILPLTDQEWFADDATNRFREFVGVVWGDEHLQENLDFVAEGLCLHAIKPKRGESALDTIRRYLSTQFFKDQLRTYKKRPIYWLFSSGKHKAFECLVYLHRYNEGTLARMRTEYVIPLSAKLNAYAEKLEQDKDASTSAAETKRLEKEIATLHKQQAELAEFDEKLRHYADQRISLDLDDGVKANYGKFGDLLAEVKAVRGEKPS